MREKGLAAIGLLPASVLGSEIWGLMISKENVATSALNAHGDQNIKGTRTVSDAQLVEISRIV